jgi:hypothetical protein
MHDIRERTVAEFAPASVEHPVLADILAYWHARRGTRAMPTRAEISPTDLRDHLGWIVLVDVLPGFTDFRYRLIGTKVAHYFGADATGRTISEAFRPFGEDAVKSVQSVHRQAAEAKKPVRAHGDAAWLADGFDTFDSIFLPLSDDGETANMVLSAFTFDYKAVKAKSESVLL